MSESRQWFWFVLIAVFFVLLYLLSPILTPFVLGALFAYLGDPLVDRLERWKLSRTLAVSVVFGSIVLILLLFFFLLVPIIETQLVKFIQKAPHYIDGFMAASQPYLQNTLGINPSVLEIDRLKSVVSEYHTEAGGVIKSVLSTLSRSGLVILGWVTTLLLTPVITFYLLRDWDKLVMYIRHLLPRNIEPTVSTIARESDEMLGAFLRGQVMVMLFLGMIYSIGLGLIGVEFALLIGIIAGLVSFVPYLGLIVGILIAGSAVMLQTGSVLDLALVLMVFAVAQLIEGALLTPLLVGERIGLHPVSVIFAVLAGGQLFGFFGVLLALPVAAVLAVILRHLHDSYLQSHIYKL